MAEKGLEKRHLEQIFTGFEKRQDEKLKDLEERVVNQFHIVSEGLVLRRQFTKSPYSPFAKGGNCYPPLWKRGARGDFLIKPLNISVLHRAINAICRSSIS